MMRGGSQTRRLLLIGFGGLLVLLAFAGLNGISVVNAIENRNERSRADYVSRERVLEQLLSDIYLSGTYARDLLFERDPALADQHREELERAKSRSDANSSPTRKHCWRARERLFSSSLGNSPVILSCSILSCTGVRRNVKGWDTLS